MLRHLLLASILIGTASGIHLQYLNIDTAEEDYAENLVTPQGAVSKAKDLLKPKAQLPGICWACEWAMGRVRKLLKNDKTKDNIHNKLQNVCSQIGFLKNKCSKMVKKYMDILIEEISTPDDPKTICKNIGICKKMSMMEFFQDFPTIQQNL